MAGLNNRDRKPHSRRRLHERSQHTLNGITDIYAMNAHTYSRRSGLDNLVVTNINCDMTVIANQVTALTLRKIEMLKSRVVPHVVSIMIVARGVVMIPWRISAKVHSRCIQTLHDESRTIYANTRSARIILNVRSSSNIIICTRNHCIDAILPCCSNRNPRWCTVSELPLPKMRNVNRTS